VIEGRGGFAACSLVAYRFNASAARPVCFETPGMKLHENGRQCWPGEEAGIIPFLPIPPVETQCRNAARADEHGMNTESRTGRSSRLRIKFDPWRGFYTFFTVRPSSFHCVSFTLPPP